MTPGARPARGPWPHGGEPLLGTPADDGILGRSGRLLGVMKHPYTPSSHAPALWFVLREVRCVNSSGLEYSARSLPMHRPILGRKDDINEMREYLLRKISLKRDSLDR